MQFLISGSGETAWCTFAIHLLILSFILFWAVADLGFVAWGPWGAPTISRGRRAFQSALNLLT